MNNLVVILCVILVACMPRYREAQQFDKMPALLKSIGVDLYNGTVIIINNGTCSSVCGPKLNQVIENRAWPKATNDTSVWLYTQYDLELLNSINDAGGNIIQQIERTELNRYGILTSKHAIIRIKSGKTKQVYEFDQTHKYR